ncbi:pimeloyl-ACP methyl ester carboxylesterase [Sphingomonas sp. UYAg733]
MKLLAALLLALRAAPFLAQPAGPAPTIVFQSGMGDGGSVWRELIKKLPPQMLTFTYDRAGYGKSPASTRPRDPCTIATELHEKLRAQGIAPPYLLVGHSLGGQYQYAFARLFPQDVAGLILVDATPPGHWAAMQKGMPGVAQMLKGMKSLLFSKTMKREFDAQDSCLDTLPRGHLPFPITSLISTTLDPMGGKALREIDTALTQDWLRKIGAGPPEPVQNSGHYIQRDQPSKLANIIADAVKAGHPAPQ